MMLLPQTETCRYTVCVPGLGKCSGDDISGLQVGDKPLDILVNDALVRSEYPSSVGRASSAPCVVWVDIQAPSASDISAMARILKLDKFTSYELLRSISGSGYGDPGCPTAKLYGPTVRSTPNQGLYLCWEEADVDKDSINQYCAKGRAATAAPSVHTEGQQQQESDDSTLVSADGYVPVPPWYQPNANQAIHRYSVMRMAENKGQPLHILEKWQEPLEEATQQRAEYLLSMLNRPKPELRGIATLEAALRHGKGEGYEPWEGILSKAQSKKQQLLPAPSMPASFDEASFEEATKKPITHRVVHVWVRGPIVLTWHEKRSEAVSQVMSKVVVLKDPVLVEDGEAVLQGLIGYWVLATQSCLGMLRRYANEVAHEITLPVIQNSVEAPQWVPVIARCRKVALALLRRCQVNEVVLSQLYRTTTRTGGTRYAGKSQKHWKTQSRTKGFSMADVIRQYNLHRQGVYELQRTQQGGFADAYRVIERRFSILDASIVARQRQRLLFAEKEILRLMTWAMAVEVIAMPIEIWRHFEAMNTITTPDRLYFPGDPYHFYYIVGGFILWGAISTIGYRYHFHRMCKKAAGKLQWNSGAAYGSTSITE
ncbi:hypothetical protein GQ54DRAFT_299353 [Martensiomyces pterosporus]|nr:hypothetical protein GQ54DRAFT_299353 [Martensiomyces pterosporus]